MQQKRVAWTNSNQLHYQTKSVACYLHFSKALCFVRVLCKTHAQFHKDKFSCIAQHFHNMAVCPQLIRNHAFLIKCRMLNACSVYIEIADNTVTAVTFVFYLLRIIPIPLGKNFKSYLKSMHASQPYYNNRKLERFSLPPQR